MAHTTTTTKHIDAYNVLAMFTNLTQDNIANWETSEDYPSPVARQLEREEDEPIIVRLNMPHKESISATGGVTVLEPIDLPIITYNRNLNLYDEIVATVENYYSSRIGDVDFGTNDLSATKGEVHWIRCNFTGCLQLALYGRRKDNGQVEQLTDGRTYWTATNGHYVQIFTNPSGTTSYSTTNVAVGNLISNTYDMEIHATIECNTRIFKSILGATRYLTTGDTSDQMEEPEPEPVDVAEDRQYHLYYESNIFSRPFNGSTSTQIGANAIHIDIQYKDEMGNEIINPYRAICGYVVTNNVPNDTNNWGNIVWIANRNVNIIETKLNPVSGGQRTMVGLPTYSSTVGFFPPYITNNTIYDARYSTNMRIFANEQDAIDFLNGGNPTPIGESGNKFSPDGFIGDKTVFNDGHDMAGGGMSSCWIMNESQLEDLANVFTTGLTKVEEQNGDLVINITKTCARAFASHGEPIDAVVDLFWIPFDPSEFVTTGASSFTLSQDDVSTATSLLKITAQSGDVVKAHGTRSFGESKEFVGNVVGAMSNMFSTTTQKVQNVGD